MNINKAIIHTMDVDLKTIVLSEHPLNFNDAPFFETYVMKLIKSLKTSTKAAQLRIGEQSTFNEVLNTQFNFIELTHRLAQSWFDQYIQTMDYRAMSLMYVQVDDDDATHLYMFELFNKTGLLGVTQDNNGIENRIIEHQAIIPNSFASVQTAYALNLETGDLWIKRIPEKTEYIESLFDSVILANDRESFSVLGSVVTAISEAREEDVLENMIKTKQIFNDNVELYDAIEPKQVVRDIFSNLTEDEENLANNSFESNQVNDWINLKMLGKTSLTKKHRIQTESGVEIILPLSDLDVTNMVDIQTDINGDVSITLRNVGKVIE